MAQQRAGERGRSWPFFRKEVSMDKGNSEDIETAVRKSEGTYYCRSGVTPVEGRSLGKIDLGGETSWVHQRPAL
jgi:hypothetical protein